MFKEIFFEWPDDGFWEWVLFVFIWLFLVGFVAFIVFLILSFIDWYDMPLHDGIGYVIDKWHRDAYTTTTYIHSGKVLVPITNYHPETWNIKIAVKDLSDDCTVKEWQYPSFHIRDTLKVRYSLGRIWNTLYIESIK